MEENIIGRKNDIPFVPKRAKQLGVATFSECRLKNVRRIDSEVSDADVEWIMKTRNENLDFKSDLVEIFLSKIKELGLDLKREVFFHISNNNYFLDFLDEKNNVAIEIDGAQHYTAYARRYDKRRDCVFDFIGISTIRFNRNMLEHKDFINKYFIPKYNNAKKHSEEMFSPLTSFDSIYNKMIGNFPSRKNINSKVVFKIKTYGLYLNFINDDLTSQRKELFKDMYSKKKGSVGLFICEPQYGGIHLGVPELKLNSIAEKMIRDGARVVTI